MAFRTQFDGNKEMGLCGKPTNTYSPVAVGAKQSVEISSDEENNKTSITYRCGSIELVPDNLKCLDDGQYIKDNIITFYFAYLLKEVCDQTLANTVYVFDSIFCDQLDKVFSRDTIDSQKLKQLARWIDGVDIFDKDFLIFPICQNNIHWVAVIVCYPGAVKPVFDNPTVSSNSDAPTNGTEDKSNLKKLDKTPGMIVLDSLGLHRDSRKVTLKVRDYLDFEWRMRSHELKRFSHHDLPDYIPEVPTQTNNYDCGIYIMMYIRCFLSNPIKFISLVKSDKPSSTSELKSLIEEYLSDNDRRKIRSLIESQCKRR